MRFIGAKQILSARTSGEGWFGNNYGMNIYKGCCHGCIYCDSRSDCYQVNNFDDVRAKENVLGLLEEELMGKQKKGIIGTGAMSDPYNPFEEKYKLTRGALKLMQRYKFGAGILTKSDLIVRDVDLLSKIQEHSPVVAKFTITTFDDELCQKVESNVAVTSQRLAALRRLSREDIFTGVLIWPILPFINDTEQNVISLVNAAAENGASFVSANFGVTLRLNQRAYFYEQLDRLFPGIKQKYVKAFAKRYDCRSLNEKKLKQTLASECERLGLLYKMSDVVQTIRRKYNGNRKQMSLF